MEVLHIAKMNTAFAHSSNETRESNCMGPAHYSFRNERNE